MFEQSTRRKGCEQPCCPAASQRCGPVSRGSRAPTLAVCQSIEQSSATKSRARSKQQAQRETERLAGTHRRWCCRLQGGRQRVRQHKLRPVRSMRSVLRPTGPSTASLASERREERHEVLADGSSMELENPNFFRLEELPPDALARVMQVNPSCCCTPGPLSAVHFELCRFCPQCAGAARQPQPSSFSGRCPSGQWGRLRCLRAWLQHLSVRDIHAALLASKALNEALQDGAPASCVACWAACTQSLHAFPGRQRDMDRGWWQGGGHCGCVDAPRTRRSLIPLPRRTRVVRPVHRLLGRAHRRAPLAGAPSATLHARHARPCHAAGAAHLQVGPRLAGWGRLAGLRVGVPRC